MRAKSTASSGDMRAEYAFAYSKAVRGKYYKRLLKEGANVVVLEPDIAKAFRSSAAVNEALRSLLRVSEATRRLTSRSSRRATNRSPLTKGGGSGTPAPRRKGEGLSILLVEQNLPLALRIADHVHVLSRGRIVHSGPACQVGGKPRGEVALPRALSYVVEVTPLERGKSLVSGRKCTMRSADNRAFRGMVGSAHGEVSSRTV